MDQRERAKKFLEELQVLSRKYEFEVTAEGTSPLLSDNKEDGWVEFGTSSFDYDYSYKIYD